jgi:hypothetical protein
MKRFWIALGLGLLLAGGCRCYERPACCYQACPTTCCTPTYRAPAANPCLPPAPQR